MRNRLFLGLLAFVCIWGYAGMSMSAPPPGEPLTFDEEEKAHYEDIAKCLKKNGISSRNVYVCFKFPTNSLPAGQADKFVECLKWKAVTYEDVGTCAYDLEVLPGEPTCPAPKVPDVDGGCITPTVECVLPEHLDADSGVCVLPECVPPESLNVDGVCVMPVVECPSPGVLDADGFCFMPEAECLPPGVLDADGFCVMPEGLNERNDQGGEAGGFTSGVLDY